MKKFAFSAFCTLLSCSVFGTQYVGINAGTNNMVMTRGSDDGLKVGFKSGFTYGMTFDSQFRAEFDCAYSENNFKTKYDVTSNDDVVSKSYNHSHTWSYMLNGIYDVKQLTFSTVYPYFGVGVGYDQNTQKIKYKTDANSHEFKAKDNRFAYQAIAGVRYPINDQYMAGLQYQYHCGKSHAKDHSVGLHIDQKLLVLVQGRETVVGLHTAAVSL